MPPFADFARNAHLRHAGKFRIGPSDGQSKAVSYFETGMLCQIGVMDDKVLPRGGALYDPRHLSARLALPGEF